MELVINQSNYINMFLQTMGDQLICLEQNIDEIHDNTKIKHKEEISAKVGVSSSLLKPTIELSEGFSLGKSTLSQEIINALKEKLDSMNIGKQVLLITRSKDVSDVESEFSDVSNIQNEFMNIQEVNYP
ncbi:hypothetical protein LguiA_021386 [Lonicera macranthoides]